ncbi:hypothetical protein NEOLEDRAFT_1072768, partial [Neolentinus lepideus HHB14362 ss-1]
IGMITMDNDSKNDTMMLHLETELAELGIPFDHNGNRVWYADHSGWAPDIDDDEYLEALNGDPVARARSLVTACRASDQRRTDFQKTIQEGNEGNLFDVNLPENELLRDVDTRWSSTFLMIDRVLELYPAISCFLNHAKQSEIYDHSLSPKEREVLNDGVSPHTVQEVLSAEKTPTIAMVFPAYEQLLDALKHMQRRLKGISHGIGIAIIKIEEYMSKGRMTRIYALAMIINPVIKLKWIEERWSKDNAAAVKEWMREAVRVKSVCPSLKHLHKYSDACIPKAISERARSDASTSVGGPDGSFSSTSTSSRFCQYLSTSQSSIHGKCHFNNV